MSTTFTHRDDSRRTASIEVKEGKPGAFVVRHVDGQGKARRKTFNNGYDAALRFVLNKEGYIVREPQDGPVGWMARPLMKYHGELGHAVDPASGRVWLVGPADDIHRIAPGTCETIRAPLTTRDFGPGGTVVSDAGGGAWVLSSSWTKADGELRRVHCLARVRGDEALEVSEVVAAQGPGPLGSLSASRDGLVLGPDAEGAALYDQRGEVLERWRCRPGAGAWHGSAPSPLGALSDSGRWVALTEPGAVRRVRRDTGAVDSLPADFKTINGLQIADDGTVFVSGFCYPSHGLYVLGDGGQARVSDDIRATVAADGQHFVEVTHGRVVLRHAHRTSEGEMQLRATVHQHWLPVLGMAKYGRACFGRPGEVIVLTDAYTVACVRWT